MVTDPRHSVRKPRLILLAISVLALILTAVIFVIWDAHPKNASPHAAVKPTSNQADLESGLEQRSEYVECLGKVHPRQEFILRLPQGMTLSHVAVKQGETVTKGQLLAKLHSDELEGRVMELGVRLAETSSVEQDLLVLAKEISAQDTRIHLIDEQVEEEKDIAKIVSDYPVKAKTLPLLRQKQTLLAQREILVARNSALMARKDSETHLRTLVQSQLVELKERLAALAIAAPFSGRVTYVSTTAKHSSAGETIVQLIDDQALTVVAQASQHLLPFVKLGGEATVSTNIVGQLAVRARIESIEYSTKHSPEQRSPVFEVYLSLEDKPELLRPGMTVSVRIHTPEGLAGNGEGGNRE